MATHFIFLKCNNSYSIRPYVKCAEIACLIISKEKQQKSENAVAKQLYQ